MPSWPVDWRQPWHHLTTLGSNYGKSRDFFLWCQVGGHEREDQGSWRAHTWGLGPQQFSPQKFSSPINPICWTGRRWMLPCNNSVRLLPRWEWSWLSTGELRGVSWISFFHTDPSSKVHLADSNTFTTATPPQIFNLKKSLPFSNCCVFWFFRFFSTGFQSHRRWKSVPPSAQPNCGTSRRSRRTMVRLDVAATTS